MNIYVGNLDYRVDENDLQGIFEDYGNVEEVKIVKDKFNGRSKGFGFVVMSNAETAQKAIEELNGATLEGRKMIVNEAREKSEGGNRSDNRYNNKRRY